MMAKINNNKIIIIINNKTYFTGQITLPVVKMWTQNSRNTIYPRNTVCFRYIIVDTLHKGDNNNNNLIQLWRRSWCSGNSGIAVRIPVESRQIFLFCKAFRQALGPSDFLRRGGQQFLSPRVKRLVCEADLSLPTSAGVKNEWYCISTLLCAFMYCTRWFKYNRDWFFFCNHNCSSL